MFCFLQSVFVSFNIEKNCIFDINFYNLSLPLTLSININRNIKTFIYLMCFIKKRLIQA